MNSIDLQAVAKGEKLMESMGEKQALSFSRPTINAPTVTTSTPGEEEQVNNNSDTIAGTDIDAILTFFTMHSNFIIS